MLSFNRHRRFQERLSPYMDCELAPRDVHSLEGHLESCEPCRRDLAGLRVAAAALRELPDVDVPRSFTLKPADVARPAIRTAIGMAHSLNSGLRLTGAGLAAVLALVLVLDVGGVVGGGDGDGGNLAASRQLGFLAADATQEDSKAAAGADNWSYDSVGSPAAAPTVSTADDLQVTPAPGTEGIIPATSTPVIGHASSGGISDGAGVSGPPPVAGETPAATAPVAAETSAATPKPLPATGGEETPATAPERNMPAEATAAPGASPQPGVNEVYGLNDYAEGDNKTLAASDSNVDPEDGPSTLLVIEVVLAALLGLSVSGIIAATYAERRRR